MGIEHFQQFNVRSNDVDEIPFILALQLSWTKAAKRTKYLIPDESQKLEGYKMVTGLFCITQKTTDQGKKQYCGKNRAKVHGPFGMENMQHSKAAKNGDEGGAEMTDKSHGDGQQHVARQRFHKPHQPEHDITSASFHLASPPFA